MKSSLSLFVGALGVTFLQPLRCLTSQCRPFGVECSSDEECVSGRCYSKKCGISGTCLAHSEICMQTAGHTCCTGVCEAVTLRNDCYRLLKADFDDPQAARLCPQLGTCAHWAGQLSPGFGSQSTPWAVLPNDVAAKYWSFKALTFAPGTKVIANKFVGRRLGQSYKNIDPSAVYPGSIYDAGRISFQHNSTVSTSMWGRFSKGTTDYCVAPITLNGTGGGFYATGKNCCSEDRGFYCIPHGTKVAGLVLAKDTEKYATALQSLELQDGPKFHSEGKGITTMVPFYLRIVPDLDAEVAAKQFEDAYVRPTKTTYCVAPVGISESGVEVNFWAVGRDCCEKKFECGPVGNAGVRSGVVDEDLLGEYRIAVAMAGKKYGLGAPARPLFIRWKSGIFVESPPVTK